MKSSRLALLGALIFVALLAIGECRSKPKVQTANKEPIGKSPSVVASASQSSTPGSPAPSAAQVVASPAAEKRSSEFQKVADRVKPAVFSVSIFDPSGKLLKTATGFFVSGNGRFVTDAHAAEGALNAVAKMTDGRIYNVDGVLADSTGLDLAVMQADTRNTEVVFVSPGKTAPQEGERIAVISGPLARRDAKLFEATITVRQSDQTGEWFEVSAPIPNELVGSPVVNEGGEIIGVVTSQRGKGQVTNVIRTASALDSLVAQVDANTKARWHAKNLPTPPTGSPAEGPKRESGQSKLVYAPAPGYPTAARHSYYPLQGNGRYRITFSPQGDVKDVSVIQSTRSETLDAAAVQALRKWKAKPGPEWSATVPITFTP
jgi:TonB family protein